MNLAETLELIRGLKAAGATHFKSDDFEVTLNAYSPLPMMSEPVPMPEAPVINEEATDKLKELIETMKLNDEDLIDKIFPAGAGG